MAGQAGPAGIGGGGVGRRGVEEDPAGVGEELCAGSWAGRAWMSLPRVDGGLTCDEYRGFALCALGPESVLALVLRAHIGEDDFVHCPLLHDLHARQVGDLGGGGGGPGVSANVRESTPGRLVPSSSPCLGPPCRPSATRPPPSRR